MDSWEGLGIHPLGMFAYAQPAGEQTHPLRPTSLLRVGSVNFTEPTSAHLFRVVLANHSHPLTDLAIAASVRAPAPCPQRNLSFQRRMSWQILSLSAEG